MFGDFAQLPPVGDKPLYLSLTNQQLGNTWVHHVSNVHYSSHSSPNSSPNPTTMAFHDFLLRIRNAW